MAARFARARRASDASSRLIDPPEGLRSQNMAQPIPPPCPPARPIHPSARTLRRRRSMDMSPEVVRERLSRRGRRVVWTFSRVKLTVDWVVRRRLSYKPVSGEHIAQFTSTLFGRKMSKSKASTIMKQAGFSSQKSTVRNARQVSEAVKTDAVNTLRAIHAMNLQPSQILVMDETGVWSNTVAPRTYNPSGRYDRAKFLCHTVFPLAHRTCNF